MAAAPRPSLALLVDHAFQDVNAALMDLMSDYDGGRPLQQSRTQAYAAISQVLEGNHIVPFSHMQKWTRRISSTGDRFESRYLSPRAQQKYKRLLELNATRASDPPKQSNY